MYTPYINKCCDMLEKQGSGKGDVVLSWQVRVQRIVEENSAMRRKLDASDTAQTYQHVLMIKGMEAELSQWEKIMPPDIASARKSPSSLLRSSAFRYWEKPSHTPASLHPRALPPLSHLSHGRSSPQAPHTQELRLGRSSVNLAAC